MQSMTQYFAQETCTHNLQFKKKSHQVGFETFLSQLFGTRSFANWKLPFTILGLSMIDCGQLLYLPTKGLKSYAQQ